jgi:WD40 repeat protein
MSWSTSSGAELARFRGHERLVPYIAWSPDGRRLATAGGFDQTARIWDARDGKQLVVLHGHAGEVQSVNFHPDGMMLVTASTENMVDVWNATGALLFSYDVSAPAAWAGFSADGGLVTVTTDMTNRMPPTLGFWSADLDHRTPDELARYVRCRVPFVMRDDHLNPAPTECPP